MTFIVDAHIKGLQDYMQSAKKVMPQSVPAFIADHGRLYTERFMLPRKQVRPKSRECYYNAWSMWCKKRDELHYVEGYIALEGCPIPVLHGWCVNEDGMVLDPSVAQKLGAVYYGVKFSRDYTENVWIALRLRGYIGIFENAYLLDDHLDPRLGVVE